VLAYRGVGNVSLEGGINVKHAVEEHRPICTFYSTTVNVCQQRLAEPMLALYGPKIEKAITMARMVPWALNAAFDALFDNIKCCSYAAKSSSVLAKYSTSR
jgi:hypothetical protein